MRSFKFLFLALACSVLALLPLNAESQYSFDENPLVGKQAPDFTLKTPEGGKLSLDEFRGKDPAIVYFWATWCPSCRKEFKFLSELKASFEKQGIKVLLVNIEESPEAVQGFLKKYDLAAGAVLDESSEVANQYGIIGVPTMFFVDRNGVIVAMEHGFPENFEELLGGGSSRAANSQTTSRKQQL